MDKFFVLVVKLLRQLPFHQQTMALHAALNWTDAELAEQTEEAHEPVDRPPDSKTDAAIVRH